MCEIAIIIRFNHFQAQSAKVAASNRTAAGVCRVSWAPRRRGLPGNLHIRSFGAVCLGRFPSKRTTRRGTRSLVEVSHWWWLVPSACWWLAHPGMGHDQPWGLLPHVDRCWAVERKGGRCLHDVSAFTRYVWLVGDRLNGGPRKLCRLSQ